MIEFCILGSGSLGNSIYVGSDSCGLLVDAGFSATQTSKRIRIIKGKVPRLDALLITHEHGDHIRHAHSISRSFELPVFISDGTPFDIEKRQLYLNVARFDPRSRFKIRDLDVYPFPVPHDAACPVGFIISDGYSSLGIITDAGCVTKEMVLALRECNAVVVEANYDEEMLASGPYPTFLKKRVSSPLGHLSNSDASLLCSLSVHDGLEQIVFAHLSRTNNKPDKPLKQTKAVLEEMGRCIEISVATQDFPSKVFTIGD